MNTTEVDDATPRGICVHNHHEDEARAGAHGSYAGENTSTAPVASQDGKQPVVILAMEPESNVLPFGRSHTLNNKEEEIYGGGHGYHDYQPARSNQADPFALMMMPTRLTFQMMRFYMDAANAWMELGRRAFAFGGRNAEVIWDVPFGVGRHAAVARLH